MTTAFTAPPNLFAALNVATGEVLYDCRRRHTGKDVLAFFRLIDLHVPPDQGIHVVLHNLSAHMGPEVTRWLDHSKRARWHLHFAASRLNVVERWFKELTDRRLRRACSPVSASSSTPSRPGPSTGTDPQPFVWHRTAAEIIEKVARGRARLTQVRFATQH